MASKPRLKLYHYWRSTSSWRVRWALELKKVSCEFAAVNLLTHESDEEPHLARNPMGYVPVLEFLDAPLEPHSQRYFTESMAIIEWLEETYPDPALLPQAPEGRAHARRLCELVNAGIQPLQNLTTLLEYSKDKDARQHWAQLWIRKGFKAYTEWLGDHDRAFSLGDQITLPDLFLIPQCYAALRQEVDLAKEFPRLARIYDNALKTPECQAAHPDRFEPPSA